MSDDERDLDHDPSSEPRRGRQRPLRRRLRVGAAVLSVMGLVVLGTGLAGAAGAPIATVFDQYYAPTNGLFSVGAPGVLGNDSGGDAALSAALANQAQFGTVALSPDGSFTYTPGPNWGVSAINDSFSYTATDGTTTSSATTVQIHGPSTWADAELTGSAPASAALDELFDSTFTLTNHGPSAFTSGQWQVSVAGALAVSLDGPPGWSCSPASSFMVCFVPAGGLASGASVTFVVHKVAPPGPNTGYDLVDLAFFGATLPTDPFTTDNSSRVASLLTGPTGTTTTSSTSTTSTSTTSTSTTSTSTTSTTTAPTTSTTAAPTTTVTTPVPTGSTTTAAPAVLGSDEDAAAAVSPTGALPYTGSDTRGVILVGAAMIVVGLGLALASRSRITG